MKFKISCNDTETNKQKRLFVVHIQDLLYTYKGNLKLPVAESLVVYNVTS